MDEIHVQHLRMIRSLQYRNEKLQKEITSLKVKVAQASMQSSAAGARAAAQSIWDNPLYGLGGVS